MEDLPRTLQALVRDLERAGDREALCALARRGDLMRWSHAELASTARSLAAGLHERGIATGEPVGLFAANSVEWIVACLAILDAGAVVTPFDAQMPAEELTHAIEDSGIRRLFIAAETAWRLDSLALEHPPEVIRLDAEAGDPAGWQAWCGSAADQPPQVGPDDLATLFYTSGTTGPPKGVPLTHGNIVSNLQALIKVELAHAQDRVLAPLPFHHVYAFTVGILTPLALQATIVLPYSMLGPQILRAMREGEATIILGVPRLFEALDNAVRTRVAERGAAARKGFEGMLLLSRGARRLGVNVGRTLFSGLHHRMAPSVRMVVSGGAALKPELAGRLQDLGWGVGTGYGLTETSPILTYNPPDRLKVDAAGVVLPGVDLRIAEDNRHEGAGEIQARGPNVFSSYWNLPDKTAKAFTEDGYYRTGDLGWFDGDGYLHIEGRASAMIVLSGGENVDPERVESALVRSAAIRDAGILEHDGRLVAVIQPEPNIVRGQDQAAAERSLREAVAEQSRDLPSHHRVNDYRVDQNPLPRTRLGKLRRHKLRDRFLGLEQRGTDLETETGPMTDEDMTPEDQQLLQLPAARRIWEALAERFTKMRLTPDTDIRLDLNVDSMDWLELTLDLRERTGLDMPEDAIGRVETVRDLLREGAEAEEAGAEPRDLVEDLRRPEEVLDEEQRSWLAPRGQGARADGTALLALNRATMAVYFRLRVDGLEHIPPEPVLFAPNHRSHLDPLALYAALPRQRLDTLYWGGWTGVMFTGALTRGISYATRVLPVDPRAGPRSSLALGAAALGRGNSLVWFPEGRRSESGELQRFLTGVGFLLQAQPLPVVPVWISGTREAMPVGRRWPKPGRLSVTFGAPTDPAELEREGNGARAEERIADALRSRVAELGRSG